MINTDSIKYVMTVAQELSERALRKSADDSHAFSDMLDCHIALLESIEQAKKAISSIHDMDEDCVSLSEDRDELIKETLSLYKEIRELKGTVVDSTVYDAMDSYKAERVLDYYENLWSAEKSDMDERERVLAMSEDELVNYYDQHEEGYFDE